MSFILAFFQIDESSPRDLPEHDLFRRRKLFRTPLQ